MVATMHISTVPFWVDSSSSVPLPSVEAGYTSTFTLPSVRSATAAAKSFAAVVHGWVFGDMKPILMVYSGADAAGAAALLPESDAAAVVPELELLPQAARQPMHMTIARTSARILVAFLICFSFFYFNSVFRIFLPESIHPFFSTSSISFFAAASANSSSFMLLSISMSSTFEPMLLRRVSKRTLSSSGP